MIGDIRTAYQAKDLLWLEFCSQGPHNTMTLCQWTKAEDLLISPLQKAKLQKTVRVKIEAGGKVSQLERPSSIETNAFSALKPLLEVMSQEAKGQGVQTLLNARTVLKAYRQWQTLGTIENNLWDRIATPLALPLLLFLGIPIALEEPRKRSIQPLTLATLALFLYLVSKPLALQLASVGVIHGGIAAFFPVLLLLILYLVLRRYKQG